MAGCSARASVIVPWLREQLAPAVDDAGHGDRQHAALGNRRSRPRRANSSGVAARPARPLAFRPASPSSSRRRRCANRSPPIPFIVGSTTDEHGGGGDRGIDGVAAVAQHAAARPRRPAAGWSRSSPLRAEHHRARRVGLGGRPIARALCLDARTSASPPRRRRASKVSVS